MDDSDGLPSGVNFSINDPINLVIAENSPGDDPGATFPDAQDNLTFDQGYYKPAKVGDFVWEDLNGNGAQDGLEPGIGDVAVVLEGTTNSGTPVSITTVTDATGMYMFGGLQPGTYKISFVPCWWLCPDGERSGWRCFRQ